MYNINFLQLIKNLLPSFLRKPKMIAWLTALLQPISLLYADFLAYRDQKLYEARISGQVNSLEWMLNDTYYNDGDLRLIYITDNDSVTEAVYIYNTAEIGSETIIFNTSEIGIDETIIFNSSEGTGGVDFIVSVPSALVYDASFMWSMIYKYKLAGTSFQIQTY